MTVSPQPHFETRLSRIEGLNPDAEHVNAIVTAFAAHPEVTTLRPNLLLACDHDGWSGTFLSAVEHVVDDLLAQGPLDLAACAYLPATVERRAGAWVLAGRAVSRTPAGIVMADGHLVGTDEDLLALAI